VTDEKNLTMRALEPRTLDEAATLARYAVASKLYNVSSPEAALMILLTGRDLGLTASQSLRAVYVVSGKPVVSSDAMVAAIRRSGLADSWRVTESTAERCTITTRRRGESEPESETFTIEDARRAGLDRKDVWRAYPRDMLRHRCAAALARRVYPDVILGCYAPGELDEPQPVDVRPSAPVVDAEAEAERRYQIGPPAPQAPPAPAERDPLTTERAQAFVGDLASAETTAAVVAVWLDHGPTLAQEGSDVLRACHEQAVQAYVAYGGADRAALDAAIKAARAAGDERARTKSVSKPNAPRSVSLYAPGVASWLDGIATDTDAGHVAGGYHKRAAASRDAGVLDTVRAATVARLGEILGCDESAASAWLDGCHPSRRSKGRAAAE